MMLAIERRLRSRYIVERAVHSSEGNRIDHTQLMKAGSRMYMTTSPLYAFFETPSQE